MSSAMSSPLRRWLLAAFAIGLAMGVAVGVGPAALTSLASAAPHHHDPTITILTGGDRTSSTAGTATGGDVNGVAGVEYSATGPGGTSTCTSGAMDCVITVDAGGVYTVTQVRGPEGNTPAQEDYFTSPRLGVGTAGETITPTPYSTMSVMVPASGNVTIPTGSTALTPLTVRSGRWAISRYNPEPPTSCARSVALLFDLSASITGTFLDAYKTAATAYVASLEGKSTNVTLYTFGSTAPAPNTSGTNNATFGPENTVTHAGVAALERAINGLQVPSVTGPGTAQYTNWDAGIWQMTTTARGALSSPYDEAIVMTDGDPTAMGSTGSPDATGTAITRFRSVEAGIFSANALKGEGTRIIALGLEAHGPGSIEDLRAISGPVMGDTRSPTEPADFYLLSFDDLTSLLTTLAVADCAKLSITKSASPTTYDHVGQTITYTYHVTNTSPGDGFTLTGITVHDDKFGTITNCTPDTLAPGESATCTATHDITQADLDAGSIANSATATGDTPNHDTVTSPPGDEEVSALQDPHITVTKTATPKVYTVGDTITYHYTVQNTGNVTLHNVTVTDTKLGTIDCTPTTLAPGQSGTCPAATLVATQADVDAGSIKNTVTAEGDPPDDLPPVKDQADDEVTAERNPDIRIMKTASPTTFSGAGEMITYTYVVTNTGNVTLHDVTVDDDVFGPITCPDTTLAPGASMTCTHTHTTTTADADAGVIKNTATATGHPEEGPPVTDEDSAEVIGTGKPGIEVTKTASPDTYDAPGQTITYTYVVTNVGAVTLTGITVVDDVFGTITCPATTLAPGASMTCTHTHTTTQADVDAGSIKNTVTATGTPPTGPKVTDEDEETVAGEQVPAIEVTKTASPHEYTGPGRVIHYTFVVTNTGNMTLHTITVDDSRLGPISCPLTTLAPGASMTCHATHTTTQADVDAGSIFNTVTATGHPPVGPPVTDEASEEVTAGTDSSVVITKTASPLVYSMHGQLITYTYTVTNTGNLTLHDVMLTDTRYGPITCPLTTLAPGESMTCTFIHAISATDLDEGSIFNSSAATGQPPFGPPVRSKPAHATVVEEVIKVPEVPVTG